MTDPVAVELVSSDFNLKKLNTKQLSENLAASIAINSSVVVIGRRGSGKTQIAKQEIKKSGKKEVYINLSVAERTDMGGYPDMFGMKNLAMDDPRRRFVNVILPQFFQPLIEGDQNCVALLDEVDKADPAIWAPLLEFVQFHSVNGVQMPGLCSSIMTGNLISEGGKKPSPPLLDRAEKYLVEADVSNWLDWAGRTGSIHPSITAYVNDHPLHLFGATEHEDNYADPSPRGWHNASEALFKLESMKASKELMVNKVAGMVGKQVGLQFDMYYNFYHDVLPMIDAVFAGEPLGEMMRLYNGFDPGKRLVTCMIACARLGTQLDTFKPGPTSQGNRILRTVGSFMNECSPENILVAVRSQLGVGRLAKWDLNEDETWKDVLGQVTNKINLS
jgi:hypothetical protein